MKKILTVTFAVLLCLLAGIGGYKGSNMIAAAITEDAEAAAEKAGLFRPSSVESDRVIADLKEKDVGSVSGRFNSVVYVVDYESGKIECMLLELFDTVGMRVSAVYFDTDISYTMTAGLYRSLADHNVLLPQTVTFRELYGYYGNDAAFDAGRRILEEMTGRTFDGFSVFTGENAPEGLVSGHLTALAVKEMHSENEEIFTDIPKGIAGELYEYCDTLKDTDIRVYDSPVIRRNESCFADMAGLWELLLKIGE